MTEFIPTSCDVPKDTRGSDRIIEICKHHKADTYHNAIGGQSLYSAEDVKSNERELKFISHVPKQYAEHDTPYLSVIDMLMNSDPREDQTLLRSYKLI